MYKKDDKLKTLRGNAFVLATKQDPHIINGAYPFLNDGEKLYPEDSKDYVIAFENNDNNITLGSIYTHLSISELDRILIK